jgi:triacylglycerol esterase/lipase EstA (alpha/beta hydrolase family)
MRSRAVVVAATVVLVVALSAAPAFANSPSTTPLPVIYNGIYGYSHASPTASPPGANNWACKPSSAHPYPVILVHGTFGDMSDSWQALSPLLFDNGYCVFALNYGSYNGSGSYGVYGTGEISRSANRLSSFVDHVLSATGASKVDIVGHSQGGMMPRYYINFLGGDSKVNALVGLAPSNHGTTLNGLFTLASYFPGASQFATADCPACAEQEAGSPFLMHLNGSGETRSGVSYTVIESRNDEVVTPYTSAFLAPGPNVTNILLQVQCTLDQGEHLSMPYDHIADTDVLDALNPSAQPFPTVCTPVAPVSGG